MRDGEQVAGFLDRARSHPVAGFVDGGEAGAEVGVE